MTKYVSLGIPLLLLVGLIAPVASAETVVTQEVEAGYQATDVSSNEAKFEKYGEVPNGVVIPSYKLKSVGDKLEVDFEGKDILQNDQSYDFNVNYNSKVKVDASYDQTPHNYSNVGRTLFNESSPGTLILPDTIQRDLQSRLAATPAATRSAVFNSTWTELMDAAHNAELQTQRYKGSIDVGYAATKNLKFDIGGSEERIEGHKPGTMALNTGFPIQIALPVDWKIYNMRMGTQYNTKKVQLGLNYVSSAFNNEVDTLRLDNPKQITDGSMAAQGRMSLAPDNWSHTVAVNAAANLPAKTRFSASGSMGYMQQDEALIPFSSNSSIAASTQTLPEDQANAKMMTWMQDYALTNRVIKPLTLGVHYHSYQLINRTSEVTFQGRSTWDTSWTQANNINQRFEYRKDNLEGTVDYQVLKPLSLGLKYGTEWAHRIDRETVNTTEDALTADAVYIPLMGVQVRGSYTRAHRRPQDHEAETSLDWRTDASTNAIKYVDLPGLRRFDVSDRLRDQGKVFVQLAPAGDVSIGINAMATHDNFQPGAGELTDGATGVAQNLMYGVQENRDNAIGIDIGWDASDWLSLDAYYNYEETQTTMRVSTSGVVADPTLNVQAPNADWSSRLLDQYHLAGLSARIRPMEQLILRLAYDITYSRGSTNFFNVGSTVGPPAMNGANMPGGTVISPSDTKYTKQDITIKADVRVTPRVTLALGYLYEKYDVSDWQNQNQPYASGDAFRSTSATSVGQTNISLGNNLQNYVAHIGSVLLKYKF